jgi:hypothetical protein
MSADAKLAQHEQSREPPRKQGSEISRWRHRHAIRAHLQRRAPRRVPPLVGEPGGRAVPKQSRPEQGHSRSAQRSRERRPSVSHCHSMESPPRCLRLPHSATSANPLDPSHLGALRAFPSTPLALEAGDSIKVLRIGGPAMSHHRTQHHPRAHYAEDNRGLLQRLAAALEEHRLEPPIQVRRNPKLGGHSRTLAQANVVSTDDVLQALEI